MERIYQNVLALLRELELTGEKGKILTLKGPSRVMSNSEAGDGPEVRLLSQIRNSLLGKKMINYDFALKIIEENEQIRGADDLYVVPYFTSESSEDALVIAESEFSDNGYYRSFARTSDMEHYYLLDVVETDPLKIIENGYGVTSLEKIENIATLDQLERIKSLLG